MESLDLSKCPCLLMEEALCLIGKSVLSNVLLIECRCNLCDCQVAVISGVDLHQHGCISEIAKVCQFFPLWSMEFVVVEMCYQNNHCN